MSDDVQTEEELNALTAELQSMRTDVLRYREHFMEDGQIDADEQAQLDAMAETIDRVEAHIEELNRTQRPPRGGESIDGDVPSGDNFEGATEINVTDVTRLFNEDRSVVDEYGAGISHDDVDQNWIGDCYFLSALAAVARTNPAAIERLVTGPNADGTYSVKLYQRGGFLWMTHQPTIVNVHPRTLEKDGRRTVGMGDGELWVMLVERAFAQLNGGYDEIEGGWGDDALETITGEDATYSNITGYNDEELLTFVQSKLTANIPMTTQSIDPSDGSKKAIAAGSANVITNHVYYILSITSSEITLRNPHNNSNPGGRELTLSFDDYRQYFYRISYTE